METVEIVAVTCVMASDGILRQPGDLWACPGDDAHSLLDSGAARMAEPAADPAASTSVVPGIGPSTAAALEAAGVGTLGELAGLDDQAVAALDVDVSIRRRVPTWRAEASRLIAG